MMVCALPNCYVWMEKRLVYPTMQLWLHALAPFSMVQPSFEALYVCLGNPQCVPLPRPVAEPPSQLPQSALLLQ